jgi:hypothetical protein
MNIAVIATYGGELVLTLLGLAIPWMWLRIVRWGFSNGKIMPYAFMSSISDLEPAQRQDGFTFWTRLAQWTVAAVIFEALVIFALWRILG